MQTAPTICRLYLKKYRKKNPVLSDTYVCFCKGVIFECGITGTCTSYKFRHLILTTVAKSLGSFWRGGEEKLW
jgi:hypothetical protein